MGLQLCAGWLGPGAASGFPGSGEGKPQPPQQQEACSRAPCRGPFASPDFLSFLFLSEKMSLPPPARAARPDSSWPGLGPCLFKGQLG